MRKYLTACAVLVIAGSALAQPGRPGAQGPRGERRTGGMRMPGMRMMDRPLTLSATPLPTLKAVFKLSAAQETKIGAIMEKAGQDMRGIFPRMERGQRPDQKAIEAAMPKLEARMKQADAEIMKELTPAQKQKVPAMLKEMHALRGSGLPMSLAGSLSLTSAQLAKLEAVGKERNQKLRKISDGSGRTNPGAAMQQIGQLREEARKKAMGALTAQQKAAVEKWEKEHPRAQFGGRMGRPGGAGPRSGTQGRPGGPGPGSRRGPGG